MNQQRYIMSDEKDEVERNRLALLEQTYDPITVRRLETLGVTPGWNCLEEVSFKPAFSFQYFNAQWNQ